MRTKFSGILTLLLAFAVQFTFAQQQNISGTVTDDIGLPLPGVNIIISGTSTGTQSDFDGNYSINASAGQTLVFSYVGFDTQERAVTAATTTVSVQLASGAMLDEVVVTAYGRKLTRNELTSSVVVVGAEQIAKSPNTSFENALQGRVTGLQVTSNSGTPGGTSTIRIRGTNSINAGNDPLYVIDGIPMISGNISGSSNVSQFNPMSTMDPNSIESVTVLKDASAVAPYGAAGSNGVILITTKNALKGRTTYSFNASTGVINNAREGLRPMNGAQKQELIESAIWNSFGTETGTGIINSRDEAFQYMVDRPGQFASFLYWNDNDRLEHNWADEVRNKDALSQNYSFAVSHGTESSTIYASLAYMGQESTVIGSDFENVNGMFKFDTKLGKKFDFGFSTLVSQTTQNASLEEGAFFSNPNLSKFFLSPWINPYDEDGNPNITNTFTGFTSLHNTIYTANEAIRKNSLTRAVPTLSLTYNILENVSISSIFTIDYTLNYYKDFRNRIHGGGVGVGGSVFESSERRFNYSSQNTIDYNFTLGQNHNFKVSGVSEFSRYNTNFLSASGDGLANDILQNISNTTVDFTANSTFSDATSLRYAALLNYSFDRRYILNASYAYQGDSKFSKDVRFDTFYSVGLGWNLHEEEFLLSNNFINVLRLRASYGSTGNSQIERNEYQALASIEGYNGNGAINISGYGTTAGWETGIKKDLGLDFSILDRRVWGSFGYFDNLTQDMLLDAQLPMSSSFLGPLTNANGMALLNVGEMQNKGFELELAADIIRTDNFKWNISGNYSTVDNLVTLLPEDLTRITATRIIEEGRILNEWYLPVWAGVDPANGDALWYTNGEGSPTTNLYAEAEQVYQGKSALPTYSGGISTRFDFKNFFLEGTLYFAGGHQVYEDWAGYTQTANAGRVLAFNASTELYNGVWQNPGDIATHPKLDFTNTNSAAASNASTRWLYDGDYMRLKDIGFGYSFKSEFLETAGLTGLTVAVRGSNLFTWVKDDRLKWDPEVRTTGFTNLTTPQVKTVLFQVNLNF